jgi:hypothetical protein
MWADGLGEHCNESVPIIYFQKPKWISEESFLNIVGRINLDMPAGFIIKGNKS